MQKEQPTFQVDTKHRHHNQRNIYDRSGSSSTIRLAEMPSSSLLCAKLTLFNGDAMAGLIGCDKDGLGVRTLCNGDGRPMLSDDLGACWGMKGTGEVGGFDNCRAAGEVGLEGPLEMVELIDVFEAC